jgi:CheY-like chemotaxis protein
MLEQKGYRIVEATNGLEAVEVAEKELPDLILMDLAMPEFDGFNALRLVREYEELAEIPMIAVTAYDMAEAREQAGAVGFAHYLTKPIDFQRLGVLIEKILDERRSASAQEDAPRRKSKNAPKEERPEKKTA